MARRSTSMSLAGIPKTPVSVLATSRLSSNSSRTRSVPTSEAPYPQVTVPKKQYLQTGTSGLQRMPTWNLVRNSVLGTFFSSPLFFKPAFAILDKLAHSNSFISSPDRNPLLRAVVKPFVYDQFCAGVTRPQIQGTRNTIKGMGYSGIILCYGKEVQISKGDNEIHSTGKVYQNQELEINEWRDGNLKTLDMVGEGDWLGIKLTGAGTTVTEELLANRPPPESFIRAMDAICQRAKAQNCRIWIDAEQQLLQRAIDSWTIDLMRRYNRDGSASIYNTLQSYLKSSRTKLMHQLSLAKQEGWTSAIKLVRGAYINNDQRALIHDTKEDTDNSYNGIVHDLLSGSNLGFSADEFPRVQLFLAGHNPESIAKACELIQRLKQENRLKVIPDFGQSQGMADEIGCNLLQYCEDLKGTSGTPEGVAVPQVYKCLTWGSIQECMQYLIRRSVENSGGAERMRDGMAAYSAELKRRVLRA